MSGPRVVYLERRDAGARLSRIRVVGLSGEQAWTSDDGLSFAEVVAGAGAWLADTLPDKKIDVLCVDTSGGVTAWIDAPEGVPENARALVQQSIAGSAVPDVGDDTGQAHQEEIARFPGLPGEAGIEALPPLNAESDRLGVIIQPDPIVRLLLNDLNRRRVSVGRVCSLWHLLAWAWAWKPTDNNGSWNARSGTANGNRNGAGDPDRVVSEAHPASALILGDPAGRLVWAWSVDGKLVASGGHRLAGERDHATIRAGDVPRLVHDWMSWSSQTGLAPDRIRIVADFANGTRATTAPPAGSADPDSTDVDSGGNEPDPPPGATALATPRAVGDAGSVQGDVARALGERWPDAVVDVVDLDDPIGETLLRAARHADQASVPELASTTGLSTLSQLRGTTHRAMYRWGGLALVGLAGVLLVGAWGVRQDGVAARRQATQFASERQGVLDALNAQGGFTPLLNVREFPDQAIQNAINAKNQRAPAETIRPILRELETMSLVIGNDQVAIYELTFNGAGIVQLTLATPDTQTAEMLFEALRTIDGSYVRWTNRNFVREERVNNEPWGRWTFTGQWIDPKDMAGSQAPAVTPSTPAAPAPIPSGSNDTTDDSRATTTDPETDTTPDTASGSASGSASTTGEGAP